MTDKKSYYYNTVKMFIKDNINTIKSLKKFNNLCSINQILKKMLITKNDFEKVEKIYKYINISHNILLFSSQSIINRKQNFYKMEMSNFYELNEKVYPTQSFTTYDNIDISVSSLFLGKYNVNVGRILIYRVFKTIKLLSLGSSIENRIEFSKLITQIILGEDYEDFFTDTNDKKYWCYKKVCETGTLGEGIINFFMEHYCKNNKLDGFLRFDSNTDPINLNYVEGLEIITYYINKKIILSGIILNDIIFLSEKIYIQYINNLIIILNKTLEIFDPIYYNKIIKNNEIIKNNIKNNISILLKNNFSKSEKPPIFF